MDKVVLDSNVVVSSFLVENGVPDQIMKLAGTTFLICTCDEIMAEADRILRAERIRRRYKYEDKDIDDYLSEFLGSSIKVADLPKVDVVNDDPKDNMIFACALKANAKYIVSGDHHVLSIKTYHNTTVLTPREFLTHVQSTKSRS